MNNCRYPFVLLLCIFTVFACSDNSDNSASIENNDEFENARLREELIDSAKSSDHSWLLKMILGSPKNTIRSIGILVYNGVNDLDMMGPRYIFGQTGIKPMLIGIDSGSFKTSMGLEIKPNTIIDSITQLDILIIPGGGQGTLHTAYNEHVLGWIKSIDQGTIYTCSVCTGAWILGAAGLLKNKKACTNWYRENKFLNKYGAIPVNERYINDGKYWSSAGVTAGMDMSLAIVQDNWGKRHAQGIMLDMEYDPLPPIKGGSPEKTPWVVKWMMESMYDSFLIPLLDSLESNKL